MLSLAHLIYFALAAAYLSAFHPGLGGSGIAVVGAAIIAEMLPGWLRRALVPELLLLVALGVSWLWLMSGHDREASHGLAGLTLVGWVLVPSRREGLRWLAVLAAGELLLMGMRPDAENAVAVLAPLALTALATDAWFSVRLGARMPAGSRAAQGRARLRWLILPALMTAALALFAGPPVADQVGVWRRASLKGKPLQTMNADVSTGGGIASGLSQYLDVGGTTTLESDGRIAARLLLESDPELFGMVYLRALTLSELRLDGGRLRWIPTPIVQLDAVPRQTVGSSWAWLYRATGCGDVVLRPDGARSVELRNLQTDGDDNWYCALLGDAPRMYKTDLGPDDQAPMAKRQDRDRFRTFPKELAGLPWATIAETAWESLPPEQAAEAVAKRLRERCRYGTEGLPKPPPVPGAALRLFLFGDTAQRRGHCQYFATATALLLRRAGHPARCVAGFASQEYDERGVVFRGLHAHAWVEVMGHDNRWHRQDPTPPAERAEQVDQALFRDPARLQRLPEEHETEALAQALALDEEANEAGQGTKTDLVLVAGIIAGILLLFYRRRQRTLRDPRQLALRRHSDEFIRLAIELGLVVRPSSTLTAVCAAVSQSTGVTLDHHLAQHLAARYGNAGLPSPWPITELRAAAKKKK